MKTTFSDRISVIKKNLQPFWKILLSLYVAALVSKILYFVTHLSFAQDQVRDVLFIRNLMAEGSFYIPFGPSTSVGNFYLPPLYYYFQLLAHYLFFDHFYSLDFLIIILESFTPLLIFYIVWRVTADKITSFGASLVYLSAVGVLTAAHAWNPNLVPLFSTVCIVCFLEYFIAKRTSMLLGAFLSTLVLINLHFQWFVLVPLLVVLGIHTLWNIRKTAKYVIMAAIIGLVSLSPYLWHESQTGFNNTHQAFNLLLSNDVTFERVRKPAYVVFFFPNFYQRVLFGNFFNQTWGSQYEVFTAQMITGAGVFALILVVCVCASWKKYKDKQYYLLAYLLIFATMALFLRVYKGDKPDYYLYVFMNFFPVLLGVFFHFFTQKYHWFIRLLPFVGIAALEMYIVVFLPKHNYFAEYHVLADAILKQSESATILVVPTHQQLEQPLKYFFSEKQLDQSNIDDVQYYVIFCYAYQKCENYLPNSESPHNQFKYYDTNPKIIDLSHSWPDLRRDQTYVFQHGSYTVNFVRVGK